MSRPSRTAVTACVSEKASKGFLAGAHLTGGYPLPSTAEPQAEPVERPRSNPAPMEAPSPPMAKRPRGPAPRPGQRPPLQRQAPRPAPPPATVVARPAGLTDEEEAR